TEMSFVGIGKNIDATGDNKYKLGIQDFNVRYVSGITVRKDYTLPFFIIGAAIFLFGVIQGMYWQHRRVWIHPEGDNLVLAAHTNKNWLGLKKDINKAIEGTSIKMPIDQEEAEEKKAMEEDEEASFRMSNLVSISSTALYTAFVLYLIATLFFGATIRDKRTADMSKKIISGVIGITLTIIGFLAQVVYFISRWIAGGHAPVSNMFEFVTFLGMTLVF